MHFYDAELLRIRARTHTTTPNVADAMPPRGASSWPASQGAPIFELRAAADDFELSASRPGQALSDALSRFPDDRPGPSWPARERCSGEAPRRQGRHPRRRHGRPERRVAAQRTRLAGPLRVDHRLPARLAARRQGRVEPRANGRIEEHGLHVWLGSYENAFALLRECYAELDRATTDPDTPIQTWDQALIPADNLGLADQWGGDWLVWLGTLRPQRELPGEPDATGREMTVVGFSQRALQLVLDFADSLVTQAAGRPCR